MRDIEADYKQAYIAEHAALVAAGRTEQAAHVAEVLKDRFGHDADKGSGVRKTTARKAPERADVEKPAENTAEPKPAHTKETRNG